MAHLTAVHTLFQPLSTQDRKCQRGELWLQNTRGLAPVALRSMGLPKYLVFLIVSQAVYEEQPCSALQTAHQLDKTGQGMYQQRACQSLPELGQMRLRARGLLGPNTVENQR